MPSAREIAATNKFFRMTGIEHVRIAVGKGSTEGTPDRLALIYGYPLLIEFKEGRFCDSPEGTVISFSGKHGLKASQINFMRRWIKAGGEVGLMINVPKWDNKWKGNKLVSERYFYRHNPPQYFLRRLAKHGGFLSEFEEIEPSEEGIGRAMAKFEIDMKSRKNNPMYQTFIAEIENAGKGVDEDFEEGDRGS